MKWLVLVLFLACRAHAQTPLELVWYVPVGPLSETNYEDLMRERDALVGLARLAGARATLLISGDVAEESLARRDASWVRLQREGFELGTLVAPIARLGTRSWRPGPASLGDQVGWVSQLIGAEANRTVYDPQADPLGQLGDPFAIAGDCSVFMAEEAVLRGVAAQGFRTFRFLTSATAAARPLWPEVLRFVRWAGRLAAAPKDGGPRRARWATASGAHTAELAWQAYTKQLPAPVVAPDRTALVLQTRDTHLAAITRLRAEHARLATTPANIEFRWWALTLWRRALASTHPQGTEAAFSRAEQARLGMALADGPTSELASALDAVFARLEALARTPPTSAARR